MGTASVASKRRRCHRDAATRAELVSGDVVVAERHGRLAHDAAPEARAVDDLDGPSIACGAIVVQVATNRFVARDADEGAARVHVQAERSLTVNINRCGVVVGVVAAQPRRRQRIVGVVAFERCRRQRRGRAMLVQLKRGRGMRVLLERGCRSHWMVTGRRCLYRWESWI